MSSGPVEQLRPITSTSSACSVVSTRLDVGAEQHLPSLGQEGDAGLDRQGLPGLLEGLAGAEDRGLDLQDVLGGLDDDQVGAALDQAPGLLGEGLDQLAEADVAQGRVVARGQEAGRADRAGDEAVVARGLARDLGGLGVDLERVLAEAPLVELDAGALEGVGLDHLGAGVEHGGVDALDHVGAVQHQRLVALALEPAVVLGGQLELLQGRAHAAVEDDDALAGCGYEVTLCACSSNRFWSPPSNPAVAPHLDPGILAGCCGVRGPGPSAALDGTSTKVAHGARDDAR